MNQLDELITIIYHIIVYVTSVTFLKKQRPTIKGYKKFTKGYKKIVKKKQFLQTPCNFIAQLSIAITDKTADNVNVIAEDASTLLNNHRLDNKTASSAGVSTESQSSVPSVQEQPAPAVEPINICPKPDLVNDVAKPVVPSTPESTEDVLSPASLPLSSPTGSSIRAGRRKRKAAPKKVHVPTYYWYTSDFPLPDPI